jgi:hypothetical protein
MQGKNGSIKRKKSKCGGHNKWEPTDKELRSIEKLVAVGLPVEMICDLLGITPRTWYTHVARDPEFSLVVKRAKATAITNVASTLYQKATDPNNPNVTAAIFYLKTQAGWRDGHSSSQESDPGTGYRLPTVRFMISDGQDNPPPPTMDEGMTIDCQVETASTTTIEPES